MQDTQTTQTAGAEFTQEELEALHVQAEALARNGGMSERKALRMVTKAAREVRATQALHDAPQDPPAKMLRAIGATMSHVYAGTVPAATIQANRARNKRARAARRLHRRG